MQASVPRARVRLLASDSGETKYRTQTDDFGKFTIEDVPAGDYIIRAKATGFRETAARIVVRDGQSTNSANISLPILDCDAPGVICDYFWAAGTPAPVIAAPIVKVRATLRPGCAVDLDTGLSHCDPFDGTDLKFETALDGTLYLTFINGAKLCNSAESKIRIDGLGDGNDWCVETNGHHKAKVFIDQNEVQPGSKELMLFVVTRD